MNFESGLESLFAVHRFVPGSVTVSNKDGLVTFSFAASNSNDKKEKFKVTVPALTRVEML